MYKSSYEYNNMDIMSSLLFSYFLLKITDMPLLAMCVVSTVQSMHTRSFRKLTPDKHPSEGRGETSRRNTN